MCTLLFVMGREPAIEINRLFWLLKMRTKYLFSILAAPQIWRSPCSCAPRRPTLSLTNLHWWRIHNIQWRRSPPNVGGSKPLRSPSNENKSPAVAENEMGDRLATIDNRHGPKCGRLLCPCRGGGWSPSNAMSPGPRPTSVPSGILIHPVVWRQ